MSMRAGPGEEGAPVSAVAAPAPSEVPASRGWRFAATSSAVLVLVLASVALVAWSRGADSVLRVIPGYSPQVPITAVCLGLLAGCVLLSQWASLALRAIIPVAATLVALIATLLIGEYVFDRSFGIESLIFPDQVGAVFDVYPGRPSIWTSVALVLTAAAVAMLRSENRIAGIVSGVALVLAVVVIELVIVAYVYDAQQIISVFGTKPMSLPTAWSLALLAVAVITARPDRPPLGAATTGAHAVQLAWMLPFAVLIPILEWLIERVGLQLGLDEPAAGVVGRVVVAIIVGGLVVWLAEARRRESDALAAERIAALERERFKAAFEAAPSGLFITSGSGAIMEANQAFADLTGQDRQALVGTPWEALSHPLDADAERRMSTALAAPAADHGRLDTRLLRPDGTEAWVDLALSALRDEAGAPTAIIGVVSDVGDRKRHERSLIDAATHDQLTGLANRRVLDSWMAGWQAPAPPSRTLLAFADIDDFKSINDTISHGAGDALLREVARRISSATRIEDLLVRLGGDEFVVAATVADDARAGLLVDRIRMALGGTARLEGRDIEIRVSVGWAPVVDDVHDALRNADQNMYEDKARRKAAQARP